MAEPSFKSGKFKKKLIFKGKKLKLNIHSVDISCFPLNVNYYPC